MSVLELEPQLPSFAYGTCARMVARRHGKSVAAQIREFLALRRAEGKLGRYDYFYYQLYDDDRFSPEQKRAFVGRGLERRLHRLTNEVESFGAAHDKLICASVLQSLGFQVPKVLALYRRGADFAAVTTLSTADALAKHLRTAPLYPCFAKPVTGIRSIAVASIERLDPETDEIVLAQERRVRVDDFVAAVEHFGDDGYLFQERLRPHRDIARLCGDRVPTIRVIVLLDDDGPEIFRTVWKIPAGDNVADNFWRKGNILAAIDPETGRVWRAIRGSGLELTEIDTHPDTGARITGTAVPFWPEVIALCRRAALAFPRLRMQAWDIAVTPDGPVPVELNVGGDYNLPQLASGSGMLDARFRRFLARCAERRGMQGYWKQLGIAETM